MTCCTSVCCPCSWGTCRCTSASGRLCCCGFDCVLKARCSFLRQPTGKLSSLKSVSSHEQRIYLCCTVGAQPQEPLQQHQGMCVPDIATSVACICFRSVSTRSVSRSSTSLSRKSWVYFARPRPSRNSCKLAICACPHNGSPSLNAKELARRMRRPHACCHAKQCLQGRIFACALYRALHLLQLVERHGGC